MKIGSIANALFINPSQISYTAGASDATAKIGAVGGASVGSAGSGNVSADPEHQVKPGRKSSPADCQTCKERKYVDGSNEGDVSFKTPGHISPEASAATVRGHEQEHVANAYEKQAKGEGKVLSAHVSLHTSICPECGRSYVSGGLTTTLMATEKENPYAKNARSQAAAFGSGQRFDART